MLGLLCMRASFRVSRSFSGGFVSTGIACISSDFSTNAGDEQLDGMGLLRIVLNGCTGDFGESSYCSTGLPFHLEGSTSFSTCFKKNPSLWYELYVHVRQH